MESRQALAKAPAPAQDRALGCRGIRMMARGWVVAGCLAVIAGCAPVPREAAQVSGGEGNTRLIEARGQPSALVQPTLDQAAAVCAAESRQAVIEATRVDADGYAARFRCEGALGGPRRILLDRQAGRPPGAPVTQAVLEPARAYPVALVVTRQPGQPADVPLTAEADAPRRAAPAARPADVPRRATPIAAPAEPARPRELGTLPPASALLPAMPPAAFWQGPR